MRAVFVGASSIAVMTARILLKCGHEAVIIERSRERIDALTDVLDCAFLHGDGSTPALLREADPEQTDFLFCLTGQDQTNILASLVGRSLGFARIVTRIENPEFEHICIELDLEDTIIPALTIGRYLAGKLQGQDPLELSALVKDEARVFSFVAREDDAVTLDALDLPSESRVICLYRDEKFRLADPDTRLQPGDEVVVLTHSRNLAKLRQRWGA